MFHFLTNVCAIVGGVFTGECCFPGAAFGNLMTAGFSACSVQPRGRGPVSSLKIEGRRLKKRVFVRCGMFIYFNKKVA
jgi:hypothetical protein